MQKADVENRQVDIAHVENEEQRITIEKEETSNKNNHWKDLLNSCPEGIPNGHGSCGGITRLAIASHKNTVTRQTHDTRKWLSMAMTWGTHPLLYLTGMATDIESDWDSLDRFKNISRNDDLLAEVK